MPTYVFRRTSTGEEFEKFMTIAQRDEFVKDEDIEQIPTLSNFISGTGVKVDDGFKDMLGRIKKANYGSNINIP